MDALQGRQTGQLPFFVFPAIQPQRTVFSRLTTQHTNANVGSQHLARQLVFHKRALLRIRAEPRALTVNFSRSIVAAKVAKHASIFEGGLTTNVKSPITGMQSRGDTRSLLNFLKVTTDKILEDTLQFLRTVTVQAYVLLVHLKTSQSRIVPRATHSVGFTRQVTTLEGLFFVVCHASQP